MFLLLLLLLWYFFLSSFISFQRMTTAIVSSFLRNAVASCEQTLCAWMRKYKLTYNSKQCHLKNVYFIITNSIAISGMMSVCVVSYLPFLQHRYFASISIMSMVQVVCVHYGRVLLQFCVNLKVITGNNNNVDR